MTTPRVLRLKTWPELFREVRARRKPFEVRWNDRDYQLGDILELAEFDPVKGDFTGEVEIRKVTFVLADSRFGIMPGYVALGMEDGPESLQAAPAEDLEPAGLLAWHEDQARRARLRGDNWRCSAADYARLPNTGLQVDRFTACAAAADQEAGFHAKAAILVRGLVKPKVVADA